MRLILGLIFAVLVFFLLRNKLRRVYRQWRGLPVPEEQGPKTVNIIVVTLLVVYTILLIYRLSIGEPIWY